MMRKIDVTRGYAPLLVCALLLLITPAVNAKRSIRVMTYNASLMSSIKSGLTWLDFRKLIAAWNEHSGRMKSSNSHN